jgi:phospholipase C
MRVPAALLLLASALLIDSCAGTNRNPVAASSTSNVQIHHVFILVEENAGYSEALAAMPYLNSLAAQYASATQYYGNTHPSIGNYFMMTVGDGITNDDSFSGVVNQNNIVRELVRAGRSWRSYAEDLPSVGYTGRSTGSYVHRHNPLSFLSDVVENSSQAANLVPFSQFAADVAAGSFADFSFIVPNICNDGHDCSLGAADGWLRSNIAPLVGSGPFQADGLLIITFDEDDRSDTNGGGRVPWVAVGPHVRRGYASTRTYQHQSTLRLVSQLLGVPAPNQAASAPDMSEFLAP